MPLELTDDQIATFDRDGFLIVEGLLAPDEIERLRERVAPLFRWEFETGLYPDETNWREGRDRPDVTRQLCNAWKADRTLARTLLRADIGQACARLMRWSGARINQDNLLWKPSGGGKPLGFHQDSSYQTWITPPEMVTCWMTLDDTTAAGGTIAYARGSHKWGLAPPIKQFHAPDDYTAELRAAAAAAGQALELVPIVVKAGGCAFHHGRTWHGSGPNTTANERRALVAHCMAAEARFDPRAVGYIYGRYRRWGTTEMDEAHFPILWREDGYRSPFIEAFLEKGWQFA